MVHESFCLLDFKNLQAREEKQDHLKGGGLAFLSRVSFLYFKLLLSGDLHRGENVMEKLTVVKVILCSSGIIPL